MLLPVLAVLGLPAPKFELSIESIMRGPALVGHAPTDLTWSADGTKLRFSWSKADGKSQDAPSRTYTVLRDGTSLTLGGEIQEPVEIRAVNRGRSNISVSEKDGDLYLTDPSLPAPRRLTTTPEKEENPQLVLNNTAVLFEKSKSLFVLTLADNTIRSIGQIPEAPAPGADATSASQDWLANEQKSLFTSFPRSSRSATSTSGAPTGRGNNRFREPYSVAANRAFVIVNESTRSTNSRIAEVPNYVSRSGYTEMMPTYEKVGDTQFQNQLTITDLAKGKSWKIAPPRPGRVGGLQWSPDGKFAVTWASTDDHKDSWLYAFDAVSQTVRVLWKEHDDAWLGGPGRGLLGWLPDGSHVYFESENTGFAHLMTARSDGSEVTALTQGNFEVSDVQLDTPRQRFIFVSSEGGPSIRHIDAIPFTGGPAKKLADFSADEDAKFALAPNGVDIAVVRSKPNRPAELYVNDKQVTVTPTEEWLSYPWIDPTIVQVPARDGAQVAARLYKPSRWRRGGPAIIFVHGAGYLQNVYNGWSHYFREYMFHHYLVEHGYAVLDMDYRASAGYGKKWRTAIYRHMGGVDLDDNVDGSKYLVKSLGVDPKRIGIYGGSYGGFITLMAMFTAPDVFAAGAALRPVADWAHYNHGYTSPILNNPQDDPEAYRKSSPIYFANGLKGALLICHGMVDTNVHFQDSVRLSERLIELGKTNWEIAPYPIEDHAFTRTASWTDEYRRIFALFERTIGNQRRR